MAGLTDSATGLGPFDLGNGLVEIAALTSMIGSTTAQTLVIGNKGPAGLVWATMTIFGAMSVVKACVAAVTPGWLRDSLGVGSGETDAAIGLSLNLHKKGYKYRIRGVVAKGVECEVKAVSRFSSAMLQLYNAILMFPQHGSRSQKDDFPIELARRDVHVFDQRETNILNAVSPSQPGDDLKVYSFVQNPYHKEVTAYHAWLDWMWLSLSSAKLAEVGILWGRGAVTLAWVTLLGWLFFILASLTLQLHDYFREYNVGAHASEIDILAGSLPTPTAAGGPRKVLLGVPKGGRQHILWKFVWALSGIVGTASVIATYMVLGRASSPGVFAIWTSFQIIWLVLRSTFFYVVDDRDKSYLVALEGKPWIKVNTQGKERVRRLAFALASYQQSIHPRGLWSYKEDLDSVDQLDNVNAEYPLSSTSESVLPISVHGVIGDTILSSVSWICGSKNSGFDFYDACIVILNLKDCRMAIPAARVMTGSPSTPTTDPEQGVQHLRPPRGISNTTRGWVEWCYWIPCGPGRWLNFKTEQMKVKGQRDALVLSDEQVTENLKGGELFVSLQSVDDVKEIVRHSTMACSHLLKIMDNRQDFRPIVA